ncbi:MAG: protoheme IX farnesyltransferase, partial [Xenococcaceae cyanobacterium]
PVVAGEESTVKQIWLYTWLTVPCTLYLIYPFGNLGIDYGAIAFYLNCLFLRKTWQLRQNPRDKQLARSLFKYSILYMMLLCTAMVVDTLPITHNIIAALPINLYW